MFNLLTAKRAGTRFLFDSMLASHGINPAEINGYTNEEWNHLSTASYISRGMADVAFGIQSAASHLGLFLSTVDAGRVCTKQWGTPRPVARLKP